MSELYRVPTAEEKLQKHELVGRKISIFWDGDNVFYPGIIKGYDEKTDAFSVVYDEGGDEEAYTEDLRTSTWKIWSGSDEEYAKAVEVKRETLGRTAKTEAVEKIARDNQPAPSGSGSSSKMSYTAMVIEAVTVLADRHGSSIQAIRKYVLNHFPLKQQQTASFNSLTLKALNKAVALEVLEYDRRLYRISAKERERRREKERMARNAMSANARDALAMRSGKGGSRAGFDGDLGMDSTDPLLLSFHGTAAAYNKSLRKELLMMRSRRDKFLQARLKILAPFLIEKNYFVRKEKLEQERRLDKDSKKVQQKQAAAAVQAANAASNIYANSHYQSGAYSRAANPALGYGMQPARAAAQGMSTVSPFQLPRPAVDPSATAADVGLPLESVPLRPAAPLYPPASAVPPGSGMQGYPGAFPGMGMAQWSLPPGSYGPGAVVLNGHTGFPGYAPYPHPVAMAPPVSVTATAAAPSTILPTAAVLAPAVTVKSEDTSFSSSASTLPVTSSTAASADASSASSLPVTASASSADASSGAAKASTTEVVEEEDAQDEYDEKQLVYSTMQGVRLLPQPAILKADLHDHQVEGISWMVHMFNNGMPMILGDQMGLGKTIQSIGFMACLQQHLNKKGPFLIVVPLSVLSNWISEIERFCPSFRAVRFHGPKNERNRIKEEELGDLSEFDIVVTTYEILVSEVNFFRRKYVWTAVIVDEGHRLKNDRSQFSEKLRLVTCLSKVILSGTPLQNNLKELWAMLYYMAPDIFQSSKPFEEGFDLARGHIDSVVLRKARKLLSVFMLRRLKEHVAIKLPSRRELTLLVPLTKQQHELYRQFLCNLDSSTLEVVMREDTSEAARSAGQSSANLAASKDVVMTKITATSTSSAGSGEEGQGATTGGGSGGGGNGGGGGGSMDSDWRKLMNLLLQLRKICNHTYLMPDVAPEPYVVNEEIVGGSGKLLMLDRMLPMLRRNGHRVLIFSQFTSMLDLLEDYCELREYPFVRLDGETNRVKRRLDVRRFNAPKSPLFIFLISTRAGGLGLNLASADTVILYDSDWNPQVDLQAMERAHRIGQTKPVRVYRLVCRGSVEERMVSRAEKKLFLNAMVAEADPDEQLHESGSAEEQNEDARKQAEISEALGIGGTAISKGELASLIRFGANAVFEGSVDNEHGTSGYDISDEDLDALLEMQGRDVPRAPKATATADGTSSSSGALPSAASAEDLDELAKAQQALRDRMQMLKEVDLRQLGSTIYDKKKRKSAARSDVITEADLTGNIPGILDSKRVRKERVVMMDGRGTGYGGAVPVLAETIEKEVVPDSGDGLKFRSRGRQWTHQTFCCMCGKNAEVPTPPAVEPVEETGKGKNGKASRNSSTADLAAAATAASMVPVNAPVKCAHCPFIFHLECCNGPPPPPPVDAAPVKGHRKKIAAPVLTRPQGMFICAHHRCCVCNRSTASAGGLLFRCTGCMTAYCEDCLPQDEIESVGRCRALEQQGYDSKQSYYIRCPYCCQLDGSKPLGILSDNVDGANGDTVAQNGTSSAAGLSRTQSKASMTRAVSLASMGGDKDGGSDVDVGEDEVPEDAPAEEMDTAEEPIVPMKTQLMRIQWTEIFPTPEPSPVKRTKKGKKKGKKGGKAKGGSSSSSGTKRKLEVSDSESSDEEDESVAPEEEDSLTPAATAWREWSQPSMDKAKRARMEKYTFPEDTPAQEGMQRLLEHPLWTALHAVQQVTGTASSDWAALSAAEQKDSDMQLFAHVLSKIEAGRYRSTAHLVTDVRYVVDGILKKARTKLKVESERTKLAELQALFISFLDDEFGARIVL